MEGVFESGQNHGLKRAMTVDRYNVPVVLITSCQGDGTGLEYIRLALTWMMTLLRGNFNPACIFVTTIQGGNFTRQDRKDIPAADRILSHGFGTISSHKHRNTRLGAKVLIAVHELDVVRFLATELNRHNFLNNISMGNIEARAPSLRMGLNLD